MAYEEVPRKITRLCTAFRKSKRGLSIEFYVKNERVVQHDHAPGDIFPEILASNSCRLVMFSFAGQFDVSNFFCVELKTGEIHTRLRCLYMQQPPLAKKRWTVESVPAIGRFYATFLQVSNIYPVFFVSAAQICVAVAIARSYLVACIGKWHIFTFLTKEEANWRLFKIPVHIMNWYFNTIFSIIIFYIFLSYFKSL